MLGSMKWLRKLNLSNWNFDNMRYKTGSQLSNLGIYSGTDYNNMHLEELNMTNVVLPENVSSMFYKLSFIKKLTFTGKRINFP